MDMQSQPIAVLDYESALSVQRRRGLCFLGIAVAGVGFAMALQMGLNSNFVAQTIPLTAFQQGRLEAFRESCGIIALGLLAILAGFAEPLIGAGMLVLLAVGLGSYAVVPSYYWLVLASFVWSQGLHVWMPLPNSMTLSLAEPGRSGHRLGQIQAAGAVGSAIGLLVALVLHWRGVQIRPLYVVAGVAALVGAAACLRIPRDIKTPGPRLVFRRRYGVYYLLSFLEGWRKQMSVAFAGYLLVSRYGTPLMTMLLLSIIVQAVGWFASPMVGRRIDRFGERRMLVFYYASLMVFFIGYATIHHRYVLYALFVLDSAFFVFAMALTTYVSRIAPPSEHTPTLSMGVAMNHIAAVTMPLVGGWLWITVGYQWAFYVGATAAAVSIVAALRIPARHGRVEAAPAIAESVAAAEA